MLRVVTDRVETPPALGDLSKVLCHRFAVELLVVLVGLIASIEAEGLASVSNAVLMLPSYRLWQQLQRLSSSSSALASFRSAVSKPSVNQL
jgi:hypothetical protein